MALSKASVVYQPSSNRIIIDSAHRDPNQEPYSFTAELTSGIRGTQIAYDGLAWAQPLFTHNPRSSELIFEIETNPPQLDSLVIYATPWIIWKSYDGNPDTAVNQPPQPGSYGHNIETLLNTDVRQLSSNTVSYTPTDNGNPINFFFRYSASVGFTFFAVNSVNLSSIPIRILPCRWLDYAHRVHGFGTYNPETNTILPQNTDFSLCIQSSVHPNLVYTRYVFVTCPELAQNRTYDSLLSGFTQPRFNMELGVFFTPLERAGVFMTSRATDDKTKVHLKAGTEPRKITLEIYDEEGQLITCSNPLEQFFADPLIPNQVKNELLNSPYVSPSVTSLLALGKVTPLPTVPGPAQNDFTSIFQFTPNPVSFNITLNEDPLNDATFRLFPLAPDLNNLVAWSNTTPIQYNYQRPYQLISTNYLATRICFPMSFQYTSRPTTTIKYRILGFYGPDQPSDPQYSNAHFQSSHTTPGGVGTWPLLGNSPNVPIVVSLPAIEEGRTFYLYVCVSIETTGPGLVGTLNSMQGPYLYFNGDLPNNQSYLSFTNVALTSTNPSTIYIDPEKNFRYTNPTTSALCEEVIHLLSCQLE